MAKRTRTGEQVLKIQKKKKKNGQENKNRRTSFKSFI